MSDTPPVVITHYRVPLGDVWLHAVLYDVPADALEHLGAMDDIWKRPGVELVDSKPTDAWYGPFPRAHRPKLWID